MAVNVDNDNNFITDSDVIKVNRGVSTKAREHRRNQNRKGAEGSAIVPSDGRFFCEGESEPSGEQVHQAFVAACMFNHVVSGRRCEEDSELVSRTSETVVERPAGTELMAPHSAEPISRHAQGTQGFTLMVCDLPCKVGERRMMLQLRDMGFDACYDYLYFPKRNRALEGGEGFCFINFMSVEMALGFKADFDGFRFEDIGSAKKARVKVASVQGLQANIDMFGNRSRYAKYVADPDGITCAAFEQLALEGKREVW
eukprot:TRINITY_DN19546_c0_g1_i1.p1 TRINITY_DN19546_c0_g1~~TRINITY_DN19546_c0_g1_i1.p1  ORF type:complete len:256 (+),score=30.51 TRINITY_DN19546_c0_g1_i1:35-802(+)